MWLGILTPGAHPSRPMSIAEATVFAWTPEGRHRIDGPFAMVHGGLRTLRRTFHGQGLVACPPRCFVCLEPCPVPDTDEVRAFDGMTDSSGAAPGGLPTPRDPAAAVLAFVHLADLDGPGETPLDEEVIVVLAGAPLAVLVPLECVPRMILLLAVATGDGSAPACTDCGLALPGSDAQRAANEAGATARRPAPSRRVRGRRAA